MDKFLDDTTTQDIFDNVYSFWDSNLRANEQQAHRPEQNLSGNERGSCRICKSSTCTESTCPKRKCARCGREGHSIDNCRANLNRNNNGNNNGNNAGNNGKVKKCSKCGGDHAFRLCPNNECHHCNAKGHIRPDCPKFEKNIKARKSGNDNNDRNNSVKESSTDDGGVNGVLNSTSFEPGMFSFRESVSETSLPSNDDSYSLVINGSVYTNDFIPPVFDEHGRLLRGSWPHDRGERPICAHPHCGAPVYGLDSDGQFHDRFCGNTHRQQVLRSERRYGDWHECWGPRPKCKGPHCDELVYGIDNYNDRTHADFCSRSCARFYYNRNYHPSPDTVVEHE